MIGIKSCAQLKWRTDWVSKCTLDTKERSITSTNLHLYVKRGIYAFFVTLKLCAFWVFCIKELQHVFKFWNLFKTELRYITIIYMKKQDKIYIAFWIWVIWPMCFILANDRKCLFSNLTVDVVKHILVRRMSCSHLISTHMPSVISLMKGVKHEVNIVI